tara:strand:- start:1089 stop:1535 length:447 start_codon:yes stop_codon:yes gene_type:complete
MIEKTKQQAEKDKLRAEEEAEKDKKRTEEEARLMIENTKQDAEKDKLRAEEEARLMIEKTKELANTVIGKTKKETEKETDSKLNKLEAMLKESETEKKTLQEQAEFIRTNSLTVLKKSFDKTNFEKKRANEAEIRIKELEKELAKLKA